MVTQIYFNKILMKLKIKFKMKASFKIHKNLFKLQLDKNSVNPKEIKLKV